MGWNTLRAWLRRQWLSPWVELPSFNVFVFTRTDCCFPLSLCTVSNTCDGKVNSNSHVHSCRPDSSINIYTFWCWVHLFKSTIRWISTHYAYAATTTMIFCKTHPTKRQRCNTETLQLIQNQHVWGWINSYSWQVHVQLQSKTTTLWLCTNYTLCSMFRCMVLQLRSHKNAHRLLAVSYMIMYSPKLYTRRNLIPYCQPLCV